MTENPLPPSQENPIGYAPVKTGIFAPPPAPVGVVVDSNARTWGMLSHLTALVQFFGIPAFLGPLVIWLVKKNEMPFVDDQGKEALNFHLTVILAALVLSPTICLAGVGIILLIALGLASLVLSIIAAMKANGGEFYRYPFSMRFIK